MLALAAVWGLVSGCTGQSGSPRDHAASPSTAPAPGETAAAPAQPKAFPAVSDPYTADQAAANGDVVNVHGEMYNLDKWQMFLANLDAGVPDQLRITQYTIEGAPIFYELVYDGAETITYTFDNSRDGFGSDAGRPSTICRDIELAEDKDRGSYYKLTGCDNDTYNTFWLPDL
ncbi:DUF4362 domain-containing protein [Cohnella fermenti]|nr:DUF4362 domain-containing protein [Cohnella fermenti]